jgi:hypothetical protein
MSRTVRVCPRVGRLTTVCATLVMSALANHNLGLCGEEQHETREYTALAEKQWKSLIPKAGRPEAGLMLKARLSAKSAAAGESVSITLSIKNVSGNVVPFEYDYGDTPEVWVRDGNRVPAKLTEDGRQRYGGWYPALAIRNLGHAKLEPGAALGLVFPLGKYFAFDSPGKYTVLASRTLEGVLPDDDDGNIVSSSLVAEPLTIHVQPTVPHGDANQNKKAMVSNPACSYGSNEPTDKEWTQHMAMAGKPVEGCILEVIDSQRASGEARLVVSLVCQELAERSFYRLVERVDAAAYRVLVRDSLGHPVAPLQPSPRTLRNKVRDGREKPFVKLNLGDAMGAMIPLRKYFNLEKPGEYWVLVRLPFGDSRDVAWVAEPIKIRVDAESHASKK